MSHYGLPVGAIVSVFVLWPQFLLALFALLFAFSPGVNCDFCFCLPFRRCNASVPLKWEICYPRSVTSGNTKLALNSECE